MKYVRRLKIITKVYLKWATQRTCTVYTESVHKENCMKTDYLSLGLNKHIDFFKRLKFLRKRRILFTKQMWFRMITHIIFNACVSKYSDKFPMSQLSKCETMIKLAYLKYYSQSLLLTVSFTLCSHFGRNLFETQKIPYISFDGKSIQSHRDYSTRYER